MWQVRYCLVRLCGRQDSAQCGRQDSPLSDHAKSRTPLSQTVQYRHDSALSDYAIRRTPLSQTMRQAGFCFVGLCNMQDFALSHYAICRTPISQTMRQARFRFVRLCNMQNFALSDYAICRTLISRTTVCGVQDTAQSDCLIGCIKFFFFLRISKGRIWGMPPQGFRGR